MKGCDLRTVTNMAGVVLRATHVCSRNTVQLYVYRRIPVYSRIPEYIHSICAYLDTQA